MNLFEECGVQYTRDKKNAAELKFQIFRYTSFHLLTGNVFQREVYCQNTESFKKLIAYWNNIDPQRWTYKENPK